MANYTIQASLKAFKKQKQTKSSL